MEEDLIDLNVKKGHRRLIMKGVKSLNAQEKRSPVCVPAPPPYSGVLEEGNCLLYIKTLSGDSFSINVLMTDYVHVVKRRIHIKKKIPLECQTL